MNRIYERISNYYFKRAALNRVVCGKPIRTAAMAADYNKIRGLITGIISHYGNRPEADDLARNILKQQCIVWVACQLWLFSSPKL